MLVFFFFLKRLYKCRSGDLRVDPDYSLVVAGDVVTLLGLVDADFALGRHV